MKTYFLWGMSLLSFCTFLLSGCSSNSTTQYVPDIEQVEAPTIKIKRFEKALFTLDTMQVDTELQRLKQAFPGFAEIYFTYILPLEQRPDKAEYLKNFLVFPTARSLYDTITQEAYPSLEDIEGDLSTLFQYYRYWFPKKEVPAIYSLISEYGQSVLIGEDWLGIALDAFLGVEHQAYYSPDVNVPYFRMRTFDKAHIVPHHVAYALADDIVGETRGNRMIDYMAAEGKKFFLAKQFVPYAADSLVYGFTGVQLYFCTEGERRLYELLQEQDLIYSTNKQDFIKFVSPSPFNAESAADMPGNSGSWLGAQMAQQYFERTREALRQVGGADVRALDHKALMQTLAARPEELIQRYKPIGR